MKYHILKGNLLKYDGASFKDLLSEEKKYGNVFWKIGNKKKYHISKNDVCYLYYINLPDSSNRIIFWAEVINSDYCENKNNKKSIFTEAEPGDQYIEMKLHAVSLDDKEKYSTSQLIDFYNVKNINSRSSYLKLDKELNKKLIKDIEKEDVNYKTLRTAATFFNSYNKCEFNCKTFEEENGMYYIERHHLVERNLIEKNKNIKDISKKIEDPSNIFNLCPMCHRKIHLIKKDQRRKMISYLYNKKKDFFDKNFNELKNNQKTIDWLFEIYKCEDTKKRNYIQLRNRIEEKYKDNLPEKLMKELKEKEQFKKDNNSSLSNGNYITFNKGRYYLDLNYNKEKRQEMLNMLKKLL